MLATVSTDTLDTENPSEAETLCNRATTSLPNSNWSLDVSMESSPSNVATMYGTAPVRLGDAVGSAIDGLVVVSVGSEVVGTPVGASVTGKSVGASVGAGLGAAVGMEDGRVQCSRNRCRSRGGRQSGWCFGCRGISRRWARRCSRGDRGAGRRDPIASVPKAGAVGCASQAHVQNCAPGGRDPVEVRA